MQPKHDWPRCHTCGELLAVCPGHLEHERCDLCRDTPGWRYVQRGCNYTGVERCDHKPKEREPDAKERAAGEEREA